MVTASLGSGCEFDKFIEETLGGEASILATVDSIGIVATRVANGKLKESSCQENS
jgi:hypothetical protein